MLAEDGAQGVVRLRCGSRGGERPAATLAMRCACARSVAAASGPVPAGASAAAPGTPYRASARSAARTAPGSAGMSLNASRVPRSSEPGRSSAQLRPWVSSPGTVAASAVRVAGSRPNSSRSAVSTASSPVAAAAARTARVGSTGAPGSRPGSARSAGRAGRAAPKRSPRRRAISSSSGTLRSSGAQLAARSSSTVGGILGSAPAGGRSAA